MVRIFSVGEIVLDMVMKEGKPLMAVPGGSTFNSLVSLGRTCHEAEINMVSQIGDDYVADLVLDFMSQNNVNTKYIKRLSGIQTPLSLAVLNQRNVASYEFYRDSRMPEFETQNIHFKEGDIVLFGSYFSVSTKTRKVVRKLILDARKAGAFIYYDINFRKNHLMQLSDVKSAIEENITFSDVVRASADDLYNVYGTSDVDYIYERVISGLCGRFICTNDSGSVYYYDKSKYEFTPPRIETVSTIGAGDAFNAGFIYSFINTEHVIQKEKAIQSAVKFAQNVCKSLFNYVDKEFMP